MAFEQLVYKGSFNRNRLVHVVDPDLTVCEELGVTFRLEGYQTTFSVDSADFDRSSAKRPPDIALIDLHLEDDQGLRLIRSIKAKRLGIPVFMLAGRPDVDASVLAMKLGATDVVRKPIDKEHLLTIVRDSLRSDVHVGAMESGRRQVEVRGFAQLTPREREVLQLITNGKSNKGTGIELGISPRTVEVHRARVMEKLGAQNTADLLRIVLTS